VLLSDQFKWRLIDGTEPQLDAARWRVWKYTMLEDSSRTPKWTTKERADAWGEAFMRIVINDIMGPIIIPFTDQYETPYQLPEKQIKLFQKVGRDAYMWSFKTKTTHLHHDFHPTLLRSNQPYQPDIMQLGGNYELGRGGSMMLTCVGLGLKSSVALGDEQKSEEVWREKVPVITEEYFKD
jgi:hypothetical protein